MAVLRDVLRTTLAGDATLAALLTGSVLDVSTMPPDQGGAGDAPRAANGVIKPHARVKMIGGPAMEPWRLSPKLTSVEIYVYQAKGYATIDAAIARIGEMLHDRYLNADDFALAHLIHAYFSPDLVADELGGAAMRFTRFSLTLVAAQT